MAKKHYLKLEYSIFLLVLLAVFMLFLPVSFENSRQATFISKWNEKFNRVEYMFLVIKTHITMDIISSMNKAKTPEEREKILIALMRPYLRIDTEKRPKNYKPRYVDGTRVIKGQEFYFDDFYYAENKTVVGIKDVKSQSSDDVLFLMLFDINGGRLPNRWGKDIYGVAILEGGKVEPLGFNLEMKELKENCDQIGVGCSYYYKIGGGFNED